MKKCFTFVFLAICFISQSFFYFPSKVIYPVFDSYDLELPPNFRIIQQMNHSKPSLNIQGLKHLRASGSGQFSEKNFAKMIRLIPIVPKQMVVLDLRQESHGFINGEAVSWTDGNYNYCNLHKRRQEIEMDEFQRLRLASQAKRIILDPNYAGKKITVNMVRTERDLVENYGSTYIRLPVTDHNRPSDEVIDQFVELVKRLHSDQWLHFHCKAGKGRTTTFLTLFDIIKNAQQVSLKDILERQQFAGGSKLNHIEDKMGERKRAAEERIQFIDRFYLYCRQVPDLRMSWSSWIEQQHLSTK